MTFPNNRIFLGEKSQDFASQFAKTHCFNFPLLCSFSQVIWWTVKSTESNQQGKIRDGTNEKYLCPTPNIRRYFPLINCLPWGRQQFPWQAQLTPSVLLLKYHFAFPCYSQTPLLCQDFRADPILNCHKSYCFLFICPFSLTFLPLHLFPTYIHFFTHCKNTLSLFPPLCICSFLFFHVPLSYSPGVLSKQVSVLHPLMVQ